MNIQKYTQKSVEAMQSAQNTARENGNQELRQEHLLHALLGQRDGLIPELVRKCGAAPERLLAQLDKSIARFPKVSGSSAQQYLSAELDRALAEAENQAERMSDEYVSVEHLMLGLLRRPSPEIKELLRQSGLAEDGFLRAVREVRGSQRVTSDNPEGTYDAREKIRSGPRGACPQPEARPRHRPRRGDTERNPDPGREKTKNNPCR
jgi:ATP-dependent Clp protease ATP-binding subunit ClpB